MLVIPIIASTIIGRVKSIPVTFIAGLLIGVTESMLTSIKPLALAAPLIIAAIAMLWLCSLATTVSASIRDKARGGTTCVLCNVCCRDR